MSPIADAATEPDRRDLLLYLHSLGTDPLHVDRALHLAMRAMARHFESESVVVAIYGPDEKLAGKRYHFPKKKRWTEEEVERLRSRSLADLPRAEIFALLRRKDRHWAILGLRRRDVPFTEADLSLLKEAANIISDHLARLDRSRSLALRSRIERKLIEPIRPTDLFYQVLHGLRTFTAYNHSASVYMLNEPVEIAEARHARPDVHILAELLGPRTKSPRVGQESELSAESMARLATGEILSCDREEETWVTTFGAEGSALADALDSRDDLGDYGRERSMICAPLISGTAIVGVLKIGFFHPGRGGHYETLQVQDFVPYFIVALRNLHRLEHLRNELEEARRFQASLLPPAHHDLRGGTLDYLYRPCDQLGGDFLDVVQATGDRTVWLLADVSGHGAKAAMLTALIKATFRDRGRSFDPASILREIRGNLRYFDPTLMVTAFCMEVDWGERRIGFANAGHPPPLLIDPDGTVTPIEEGDPPIFAITEFGWDLHERPLPRGGALLAYTDGILEAEAEPGDEFGDERLADVIREHAAAAGPAGAAGWPRADLLGDVFAAVDRHRVRSAQADDYTALLLRFDP